MHISLDTETTGIDFSHGAKPFFVTIMNDKAEQFYWYWQVDPITRRVLSRPDDLDEIRDWLRLADRIVMQNAKFDLRALATLDLLDAIDFDKIDDTLIAGHILGSGEPHDLTAMSLKFLQKDIEPAEEAMRLAAKGARAKVLREFPAWLVAQQGSKHTPSARGKVWTYDYWLPGEYARVKRFPSAHEWFHVVPTYGNLDSDVTLAIWKVQELLLKERGLWKTYCERRRLIEIIFRMEYDGVTYHREALRKLLRQYRAEAAAYEQQCLRLVNVPGEPARLERLPKAGASAQLKAVLLDHFCLIPHSVSKKTGAASLDKYALQYWADTLPVDSVAQKFIIALQKKRKYDTHISAMESYERFGRTHPRCQSVRVLSPSLNPTGSNTLRFTSSNPNEQNISKQEDFNLRFCFGPQPRYEWWSLDYENIELRIPAYEAGEDEMIDLFEHPERPPYYGSYHLLVAHVLHPDLFEQCLADGVSFKDRYKATWYQWVKNGNFATQYGAVEESGTADRAYHVPGGQSLIKRRFSKITQLNQRMIGFAQKFGYVLTMTDKRCGTGYPLMVQHGRYGRVKPTIPLNYHVQGTAMWCMCSAMVRCNEYLKTLPVNYRIVMQIHDELVFEMPARSPRNQRVVAKLCKLMEQSGDDIGIPLRVDVSYHPKHWGKSEEPNYAVQTV